MGNLRVGLVLPDGDYILVPDFPVLPRAGDVIVHTTQDHGLRRFTVTERPPEWSISYSTLTRVSVYVTPLTEEAP